MFNEVTIRGSVETFGVENSFPGFFSYELGEVTVEMEFLSSFLLSLRLVAVWIPFDLL